MDEIKKILNRGNVGDKVSNVSNVESTEDSPSMYSNVKKGLAKAGVIALTGIVLATGYGSKDAQAGEAKASVGPNKSASFYMDNYGFVPNPGVEIEDGYHPLPSTKGWKFLGSYMDDRMDTVPGKESELFGYQRGNVQMVVSKLNGKAKSYWFHNIKNNKTFGGRTDYNADGNFEQKVPPGGIGEVDLKSYGLK